MMTLNFTASPPVGLASARHPSRQKGICGAVFALLVASAGSAVAARERLPGTGFRLVRGCACVVLETGRAAHLRVHAQHAHRAASSTMIHRQPRQAHSLALEQAVFDTSRAGCRKPAVNSSALRAVFVLRVMEVGAVGVVIQDVGTRGGASGQCQRLHPVHRSSCQMRAG